MLWSELSSIKSIFHTKKPPMAMKLDGYNVLHDGYTILTMERDFKSGSMKYLQMT